MARIEHKDIGDRWQPQATFTVSGSPTDPTTLVVKQQTAAGVESTLFSGATSGLNAGSTPVAKLSAGVFKLSPGVALDAAGYWFVRFEGTGVAEAAEDHQVIVDPSEFYSNAGVDSRALVTLAETKDWLQQRNIDTTDDLEIVALINDMSDRFHHEAEREFKVVGTNPQTRTFVVEHVAARDFWYIDGELVGDLSSVSRRIQVGDMAAAPTAVEILDTDWTTSLETVDPAEITVLPTVRQAWQPIVELELQTTVTALRPGMRVEVTGNFGFPQVPGNVRRAVLDAVADEKDRDVEHYRQDLAPTSTGESANVIVFGRTGSRPASLPPRAMAVARSYRTRPPLG